MLTYNRTKVPNGIRVGSIVKVIPTFDLKSVYRYDVQVLEFAEGNNGVGFLYIIPGYTDKSFAYFTQVDEVLVY